MIVTSLSASLLQKISAAVDCLCQITLNRKLACTFEKWCKFASRVKAGSRKRKRACIWPVPVADRYTTIAGMETAICSAAFCQCSLLVVLCCSTVSIHEAMDSLRYGYFVFIAVI